MSEVRLYIDEDASESAVVTGLVARGFNVLTTLEVGRTGTSDRDQLDFAVLQGRSIYTLNVADFAGLHAEYLQQGHDHCGIIVIPEQRYHVGEKIRRLAAFLYAVRTDDMVNRMEYL